MYRRASCLLAGCLFAAREKVEEGWNFVVFASYAVGWRRSGKRRQR
jgi:hypothetical protein